MVACFVREDIEYFVLYVVYVYWGVAMLFAICTTAKVKVPILLGMLSIQM